MQRTQVFAARIVHCAQGYVRVHVTGSATAATIGPLRELLRQVKHLPELVIDCRYLAEADNSFYGLILALRDARPRILPPVRLANVMKNVFEQLQATGVDQVVSFDLQGLPEDFTQPLSYEEVALAELGS